MPSIYYFLTLLGGGGEFTTHTGKQQEMERLHGDIKGKPKGTTRNTNSNHHGFNRKSLGTNRKSIAMNGHRKESTGNQKGWMACAINSERTNILLPVGAGCPLCHLYIIFLTLLGGGGEFSTHTGKQQEIERLHGDIKGKPKGTTRNTNSNHQEIKWFQQEITRHQQEIHSHEWTQKGIHRKSKRLDGLRHQF